MLFYPQYRKIFAKLAALLFFAYAAGSNPAVWADDAATDVSTAAAAQDSAASDTDQLQQVVVTAEKRSENSREIPISLTAVSAQDLARHQIVNYDDLSRLVPGLSFGAGGSEGLTNIEIRGVSSLSGSATVGVFLDDISMTTPNIYNDGTAEPQLYDVDHIEVLRGPQGTLWGASSMGGTIRFVTKQPDVQQGSADFSSGISNTDHGSMNYVDSASVNIPLVTDMLAVRASVGYTHDSGYIDNYNYLTNALQDKGTNRNNDVSAHITVRYLPSDNLTVTASMFAQQSGIGDSSVFYPDLGLFSQNKEVREDGRDMLMVPTLTVVANLGFADLTSVSGFFDREYKRISDGTYYNSYAFAAFYVDPLYPQQAATDDATIGTSPSAVHWTSKYSGPSQEIRLSSPEGGRVKWVAGLYYSDVVSQNQNVQRINDVNGLFQKIYGVPVDQSLVESAYGSPGLVLFPDDLDGLEHKHLDERRYAAFGQATIDLRKDLHATVGLRSEYVISDDHYDCGAFYFIGVPCPFTSVKDYRGTTPKVGLAFDVTDDVNVYASATKGYRVGGPNEPLAFGPTALCNTDFENIGVKSAPYRFDNDSLWSYELGTKSLFLDNRLSVNTSIYYIQWNSIQQAIYLPTCGAFFTANVGDAFSKGGELEIQYKPLPGLTLGLNGSLDEALITSTTNSATAAVGEHVLNTPGWNLASSVNYEWQAWGGVTAFAHADYDWTGNSYGSYTTSNANYRDPAYYVVNASAGIDFRNWEISVQAKNLTNDATIIQTPEINTVFTGYTLRPRTIGLLAKAKF
jgi:iron complex outermembrane recepter protein